MRVGAIVLLAALALAGCGGGSGSREETTDRTGGGGATAVPRQPFGKVPRGAVEPAHPTEEAGEGPAASEASPEAAAEGPAPSGSLSGSERASVSAVVSAYIAALDHHDGSGVCRLLGPGALDLEELPSRGRGCPASLAASIATRPSGGGPAWRKTALVEVKAERLGDGRARVSATVTHHFSDRKYVSVEDDVIYLERVGARWLLAKPSGTLYRAVGYGEPPLRAFSPPPGW